MTNRDMIDTLLEEHADNLTAWESEFLEDLQELDDVERLSSERQSKLDEIYEERAR